jgi:hypothetical protein
MKKIYKTPIIEVVNVKLYNTILDDPTIPVYGSKFAEESLGKEQGDFFDLEEDDSFGDIWGTDEDSNDLWN